MGRLISLKNLLSAHQMMILLSKARSSTETCSDNLAHKFAQTSPARLRNGARAQLQVVSEQAYR